MRGLDEAAKAVACMAAGATLIAFAPIGVRLSELGPQATAVWRLLFALPVLGAAFLAAPERLDRRGVALLAGAGVAFGLDLALFHAAIVHTSVANATLLSNMTPIFATGAGWLLFKERIGWGFLLGAGIGFAGAVTLAAARTHGAGQGGLAGDAMALASAVFYGAYLLLVNVARKQVGVIAVMFITTAAALAPVLAATAALHEAIWPQTWRGWAVLAGLGLVVHVGGQGLVALGIGRLPVGVATVLLWIQPVTAAAISWALFGEKLGALALLGGALVLGGVWIVQRSR